MTRASRPLQTLTFLEALVFSGLVGMFIWRWQAADPYSWVIFPVWLVASFLLHRDTPKTLGWRGDNFGAATSQGLWMFAAFIAAVVICGICLGALHRTPQHLLDRQRFIGYFAFCTLQQVAVNSYLMNRFLYATSTPIASSSLQDTNAARQEHPLIAGFGMCLLFARQRNILPLTLGQAILGGLTWWAFPIAWHHSMRVGPGYYAFARRLVNW